MVAHRGNGVEVTPLWMPDGRPLRHMRWGTPDDCGAAVVTGAHERCVKVLRVRAEGDGIRVTAGNLKTTAAFADLVRSRELLEGQVDPWKGAIGDVLGLPWSELVQGAVGRGRHPSEQVRHVPGETPVTGPKAREAGALVSGRSAMVADLLGRDVVDFLARHGALDADGLHFHGIRGQARLRRMQAVSLYPYILPMLPRTPGMAEAVDAGRPFEPLLASSLGGVGLSTLRRTRGLAGVPHRFDRALKVADALPPERVPTTTDGWAVFGAVAGFASEVSQDTGIPVRSLLSTSHKGDWRALHDRLTDAGEGRRTSLDAVGHQMADSVGHLMHTLVRPMAARAGVSLDGGAAMRKASDMMLAGKSVIGIVEAVRVHHEASGRIEAEVPKGDAPTAWPACFPVQRMRHGVYVVPLTTPSQLRDEGASGRDGDGVEGLSHCVGNWSPLCVTGKAHVLSVRRREGDSFRRLATADVRFVNAGLIVREVSGHRNGEAAEEVRQAIEILRRRVASGRLQVSDLARAHRDRVVEEARWRNPGLRFDPREGSLLSTAWEVWRPFLTARHAAMDLDDALDDLFGSPAPEGEASPSP